jgi:Na+-driven multidrug efflux pump
MTTALIFSVLAYAAVFLGTSSIVGAFNSESHEGFRSIAEKGLREYFLFMPFMGVNSVFSVYFTSMEKPGRAQMISLLRGTVLVIPIAITAYILRSMTWVWATVPAAEAITAVVGITMFVLSVRKKWTETLSPLPTR